MRLSGTLLTAYSYVWRNYKCSSFLKGLWPQAAVWESWVTFSKRCIFTGMVVQHWKGLTQGSVESASFEVFKTQLAKDRVTRSHVGNNPISGRTLDQTTSRDFFQTTLLGFYEVKKTKTKTNIKEVPWMDNFSVNKNKGGPSYIALFHPPALGPKLIPGINS